MQSYMDTYFESRHRVEIWILDYGKFEVLTTLKIPDFPNLFKDFRKSFNRQVIETVAIFILNVFSFWPNQH